MNVVPNLAELIADPGKASLLPVEAVPALRGKLAELDTLLQMRVAMADSNGHPGNTENCDRLLDAREAAAKLNASTDYLYRHSKALPFTVRIGRKVRFSEQGVERYIRQRMGRH